MGAFLDKPLTEKLLESGEGNGLKYGVASMQGWRLEMEDAHMAKTQLGEGELKDWSYFAVFDGHAGAGVSKHCASHLLEAIMATDEFQEDTKKGIHTGFLELDSQMRSLPELSSGEDRSGTTAVCAFISPRLIYIANCGDSRAVLCRQGEPVFSTQDHKPGLPSELDRIVKAGGSVMISRVNGSLAVSRALGDYDYKNVEGRGPCEQLVSPEPDIFVRDRDDTQDEFLVLACDGVWDVMSNEDLCQYIHNRLLVTENLSEVTSQVIDTCLYKGSRDNMSIVLIVFPGAPTPTPEAIEAEKELDATIERRIREIVQQENDIEWGKLLVKLRALGFDGLPPGGGLASKGTLMTKIYSELCPKQADSVIIIGNIDQTSY
ncbi:protein phosphatase 1B-like isoform X1 [Harmonia axyridis]|uniref:protein phosphatase 1B-like isoform X1 n=1 Tax=Harmonia axyridis TaxID=115357 RepID=UPI001E2783F9|nr:protein phosphatase 1B-like isoform X1 [Harmonia axyridis]XP_045460000.1 protein phosphatase 1B-like isoform X1 [Harmonia axyridis]